MARSNDENGSNGVDDTLAPEVPRQKRDKIKVREELETLNVGVGALDERLQRVEQLTSELENTTFGEIGQLKNEMEDMGVRYIRLDEKLLETIQGLRSSIEVMQQDLALCKQAIANGGATTMVNGSSKVDFPKPSRFNGARDAQEVENFIWEMELYFENINLTEEMAKIKAATSYLADTAMLWWRRRHADIERGTFKMDTWADFKRELKRQFYPENVVYEARKKLRELRQKGNIRDYVNEFTRLMLQIPSMSGEDFVFHFIDGLEMWAKQELQRRGTRSIDEAIAAAESLSDFHHQSLYENFTGEKEEDNGGGGRWQTENQDFTRRDERGSSRDRYKPAYSKGSEKSSGKEFIPRGGCYVCKGPHSAKDCPKLGSLSALIQQQKSEEEIEVARMGSMRLLDTLPIDPEPGRDGMYRVSTLQYTEDVGGGKEFSICKNGNQHSKTSKNLKGQASTRTSPD